MKNQIEIHQIQYLFDQTLSLEAMVMHFFELDYWKQVAHVFRLIGTETLIGGLILGLLVALIGYRIAFYFIIGYRTRKKDRSSALKRAKAN